MDVHKRRQAILALLQEQDELAVNELARRLGVSANTIRNDLAALEAADLLQRVRGGAVAAHARNGNGQGNMGHPDYASRMQVHAKEKKRMGQWAASLVRDGDAIVLDASTTVYHMATYLQDRQNLTVVTNGLEVALLLARTPSNKVILAANELRPDSGSVVGRLNMEILSHFFASKCFVSCTGLSAAEGLTETHMDEAIPKSQMIKLARELIALVDHSKFEKVRTYRFADLAQISRLIVDEPVSADWMRRMRQVAEIPITVVGPSGVEHIPPVQSAAGERRYRVGFGNMTEKMIFCQQVRRNLEGAARKFPNIELLVRDNDLDPQKALENAEWFVANHVDLAVEFQIDAAAGNVIMDRFNRAGIPVIAVDIPMPGATFFGADNYRAGFMAGEALGRWIKDNWEGQLTLLLKLVATRVGPMGGARLQGLQDGVESIIGGLDTSQVIVIETPVLLDESKTAIAELLPSLLAQARIGIVGINDEAVIGALAAFEQAGRLHQVVGVGQNADRMGRAAVRRPAFPFIGTTRYAPEDYGEQLLQLTLQILRGEAVPPAVYNQHVFITRNNIDDYYPLAAESTPERTQPGAEKLGVSTVH